MPSLLDDELEVTQSTWIVSLLRKPAGSNPEHAFIVVEGSREEGRTLLRRYDLFVEDNVKEYKVHMNELDVAQNLARKALINDMLKNEEVYGKSWQLGSEKADELHEIVNASRREPQRVYNILGDVATAPKTAPNSKEENINCISSTPVSALLAHGIFTAPGHNCFTWARAMLRELELNHITSSLPTKSEELVASITSRLLSESSSGCRIPETKSETGCKLM